MIRGLNRTAAILVAIVLGSLIPQAHFFSEGIRWLIMAMLFGVFLQVRLSRAAVHRTHLWLLAANIAMGFVGLGFGWLVGGRDVALAAFFAGITPTASAAPVLIAFLRGRVDYVIAAFVITNVGIASLIPTILPFVLGQSTPGLFGRVAGTVALIVFCPLGLALLVRRLHPQAEAWPDRWRNASFMMWVTAMFLITSNASHFIRTQMDAAHLVLLKIVFASMAVCSANFWLGRIIGGKTYSREASQALGQKNTSFTIYLALTYATPLVALGPTFYVVWHNIWNSWQLHRSDRSPGPRT